MSLAKPLDIFHPNIQPEPNTGCWLWLSTTDANDYGRFFVRMPDGKRRARMAHRLTYEFARGPIPEGMTLDHLCRVRFCVNPDHLDPCTSAENTRRGAHSIKTHCPHGHIYDEANTYRRRTKAGGVRRDCRTCQIENNKKWRCK